MSLERDMRVTIRGKFDYQQRCIVPESSTGGSPFEAMLENQLAMPSMCLIDLDSALEFSESIPDKLQLLFTEKNAAAPKIVVKSAL